MKRITACLSATLLATILLVAGCGQPPTPAATQTPPAPTKAAAPVTTGALAPTSTAGPQPTPAPAKKTDFPTKGRSVTIIVPWAAGGSTDVSVRALAPALERELGVPVQVVNKTGAGTQVGLTELAMAKPDGYTIGATLFPTTNLTYLDPERKATYSAKSFTPIAGYSEDPVVVGVKADSPYKTPKELFDAIKANPEKLKAGTNGLQTNSHLSVVMMEKAAGARFATVHFDGGAPNITALLGNHIDCSTATGANFAAHFRSGAVRFLGSMSKAENRFYPGVKTFEAQGYKIFSTTHFGLSAPAGTPQEVVEILSGAVKRTLQQDDVKKRLDDMNLQQLYMPSTEYAAYWQEIDEQVKPYMGALKGEAPAKK